MKYKWFSLILVFLSLCGCADSQAAQTLPATEPSVISLETEPAGLYQSGSHLEKATGGALKVFPLGKTHATAVGFIGDDLLLMQEQTICVLSGESRYLSARLSFAAENIQILEDGLACWDADAQTLVFLDSALTETHRICLPGKVSGCPMLSQTRESLYYCTENALRVLELSTGLDRLLRETASSRQTLTGIHWNCAVLECTATDQSGNLQKLFFSAADGRLLHTLSEKAALHTYEDFYICTYPDGDYQQILCGKDPQTPLVLEHGSPDSVFYPIASLRSGVAVSCNPHENTTTLDYYNLETGSHSAGLTLPGEMVPESMIADPGRHALWFLLSDPSSDGQLLCCWDLSKSGTGDRANYLQPRYTPENPDLMGLQSCRTLAAELSEKYAVRVLLWEEAVAAEPWDYRPVPEYRVPVIRQCLTQLDAALSRYPSGFLRDAAAGTQNETITIRLVKSLQGITSAGAPALASGAQYRDDDGNIQLFLSSGKDLGQTVHHELFHIFESRVFSLCNAYDNWQMCNPPGFTYDYNYTDYLSHGDSPLLAGDTRAFIDAYSMSFPREDRARIMEYAMLPEQEGYFQSEIMQHKLRMLCTGLRQAFKLTDFPQNLPWEQYLTEPLP